VKSKDTLTAGKWFSGHAEQESDALAIGLFRADRDRETSAAVRGLVMGRTRHRDFLSLNRTAVLTRLVLS
jgi:hypothetical protein